MPEIQVGDFSLSEMPQFGRLDELCRCFCHAFFIADDFRRDTRLFVLLAEDRMLRLSGETLRGISPDERSIGGMIRHVFRGEDFPGVELDFGQLEDVLEMLPHPPILLDELGQSLFQTEISSPKPFVLGGPKGVRQCHLRALAEACRYSLGPQSLLSSQCFVIVHNILDRLGW